MNGYEISSVFKVNYCFEECGRFFEDLFDIEFNDLHLYSSKCRSHKCEEMIVIFNINFCSRLRKGDGFNPISIKKPTHFHPEKGEIMVTYDPSVSIGFNIC